MERTHFKYARQTGGKGHYAEVTIEAGPGYHTAVIDACEKQELVWKTAAIQGVNYALENILLRSGFQFSLVDIDGHICHSSNEAFFVAGVLAVFKYLKINLNESDNAMLVDYPGTRKITRCSNLYEVP